MAHAMADPFGRLFFPLTSFKISRIFQAGDNFLDVVVKRGVRGYSSEFKTNGKPVKLALEKVTPHDFTQALLQAYYFRKPDKEYGAPRQFLARMGWHKRTPLELHYREQKYLCTLRVKHAGSPLELQFFYSPVVGQLVVRAGR